MKGTGLPKTGVFIFAIAAEKEGKPAAYRYLEDTSHVSPGIPFVKILAGILKIKTIELVTDYRRAIGMSVNHGWLPVKR